jgi:hypothetical protein
MTDDTTPTELTERLAALGRHPVDPATASQHLSAMAGVSLGRTGLRQKLQVAGALMAGIFIGGTGLATAGALGSSAERAADKAVDRIAAVAGVDAEHDDKKKNKGKGGDKVADADDADKVETDDGTKATDDADRKCSVPGQNHGQAVRAEAQKDTATGESVSTVAQSDACAPKPADQGSTDDKSQKPENPNKGSENAGKASANSGSANENGATGQDKAADARKSNSGSGDADESLKLDDADDLDDTTETTAKTSGGKGTGRRP